QGHRRGLRDLRVVLAELVDPGRSRRRGSPRADDRRPRREPRAAPPGAVARAGERGPAPGRGVSVPGEPAGKMMFPLVRDLADDGVPVTVTCRVLKLCRQQYYRWLERPITDAELDEAWLANAIFDAHGDDP